PPPTPPLFPYTTLFRSIIAGQLERALELAQRATRLARDSAITVGMVYGLTAQARVLALRRRFPEALAKSEEAIALIQKQGQVERSEEHTSELQSRGHLV